MPIRRVQVLDPRTGTGWGFDTDTGDVVLLRDGTEKVRVSAAGLASLISSEARGDILRRGASAWERLAAATSGQILVGDGTDLVSVAVSGDASLSAAGALTVTDVTVGSDAAGDLLYKSSATALARLAKGTAAQLLQMNSGATAPQWSTVSGDASIAAGGVVTLADNVLRHTEGTISSADLTGTGAGQFGHANGYPLVSAVGTHNVPELVSCVLIYDHATADYGGGGNTTVNFSGGGAALSGAVSAANFAAANADKVVILLPTAPTNNALVENAGINLVTASAFTQPGTAAGVIRYKLTYRVHPTGLA